MKPVQDVPGSPLRGMVGFTLVWIGQRHDPRPRVRVLHGAVHPHLPHCGRHGRPVRPQAHDDGERPGGRRRHHRHPRAEGHGAPGAVAVRGRRGVLRPERRVPVARVHGRDHDDGAEAASRACQRDDDAGRERPGRLLAGPRRAAAPRDRPHGHPRHRRGYVRVRHRRPARRARSPAREDRGGAGGEGESPPRGPVRLPLHLRAPEPGPAPRAHPLPELRLRARRLSDHSDGPLADGEQRSCPRHRGLGVRRSAAWRAAS